MYDLIAANEFRVARRRLARGVLRVRESKSEEGERAIALPPRSRRRSATNYQRTPFKGQDELVF